MQVSQKNRGQEKAKTIVNGMNKKIAFFND